LLIDEVVEFLESKEETIQEWVDERSEKWHESESADLYEDFIGAIEDKVADLEAIKEELAIEDFLENFSDFN